MFFTSLEKSENLESQNFATWKNVSVDSTLCNKNSNHAKPLQYCTTPENDGDDGDGDIDAITKIKL